MSATNNTSLQDYQACISNSIVPSYSLSRLSVEERVSMAALPPSLIAERVAGALEQVPWKLVENELPKEEFTKILTYVEENRHQLEVLKKGRAFFVLREEHKGLVRRLIVDKFGDINIFVKKKCEKYTKFTMRGDAKYVYRVYVLGQQALRAFGNSPIRYTNEGLSRRVDQLSLMQCFNEDKIGQLFQETPHVVHYYDVFYYRNAKGRVGGRTKQGILMPYYEGGTLEKMVSLDLKINRELLEMFLGVVRGVKAISAAKVIHRDLKPENIFLDVTPEGKKIPVIGDFGLAVMEEDKSFCRTVFGPLGYAAPEMRAYHHTKREKELAFITRQADIYMLAIVFGELTLGKEAEYDRMSNTVNKGYIEWEEPSETENPWEHLVYLMSRTDPKQRPTIEEIEAKILKILETMPFESPTASTSDSDDFV